MYIRKLSTTLVLVIKTIIVLFMIFQQHFYQHSKNVKNGIYLFC